MKRILLTIFIFFSINTFSQTYFPFPDSTGTWKQFTIQSFGPGQEETTPHILFMNGDTTINGKNYTKIYKYSCPTLSNAISLPGSFSFCQIDTLNSQYYGGLRETNKQIYFIPDSLIQNEFCYNSIFPDPPSYNQELLLYNFNKTIGDTILYSYLDSSYIYIYDIDSILIDNSYRKQYHYYYTNNGSMSCYPNSQNYVEGLGDINNGLFSILMIYFESSYYFGCYQDNQISYVNYYNVTNCETVSTNNKEVIELIEIYPNPAKEKLNIRLDNYKNSKLEIYDILGNRLFTFLPTNNDNWIDISILKTGIYILKIIDKKGDSISKRINII
ncbi:MAG: T9SS type A sorting domain-containing protein [Flavobacteriales bacterium]|nr:T9SS type A sorting domain-containing protein [Flavobacteriales bacterium]MCB9335317.1 T9SS type A sorting domain-containing protein [Flavobacteriales bacterium]